MPRLRHRFPLFWSPYYGERYSKTGKRVARSARKPKSRTRRAIVSSSLAILIALGAWLSYSGYRSSQEGSRCPTVAELKAAGVEEFECSSDTSQKKTVPVVLTGMTVVSETHCVAASYYTDGESLCEIAFNFENHSAKPREFVGYMCAVADGADYMGYYAKESGEIDTGTINPGDTVKLQDSWYSLPEGSHITQVYLGYTCDSSTPGQKIIEASVDLYAQSNVYNG